MLSRSLSQTENRKWNVVEQVQLAHWKWKQQGLGELVLNSWFSASIPSRPQNLYLCQKHSNTSDKLEVEQAAGQVCDKHPNNAKSCSPLSQQIEKI